MDKRIIEKAIRKALGGGWTQLGSFFEDSDWTLEVHDDNGFLSQDVGNHETWEFGVKDIIFNHDFAKALWGEEPDIVWADDQRIEELPSYKYHLQQMVIADDPIKYLGENI